MKIFEFLSKAYSIIREYAETEKNNMNFDEQCRASNMDDYELMHEYEHIKNCENNPYSRMSIRKDKVAQELKKRDYYVED